MLRRRRWGPGDGDDELEAQVAVVGEAGEEPAPPGVLQRDDVVAGGPLVDRVALKVALPERLAVHLRHRELTLGVVEHCIARRRIGH